MLPKCVLNQVRNPTGGPPRSIPFVCCVLLAAWAAPTRADDSQVGQAGATVFPVETSDVSMVSERIAVDEVMHIVCEYGFLNSGPTRVLTIGFPQPTFGTAEGRGEADLPITDFRVWDGDRELEVRTVRGSPGPNAPPPGYPEFKVFDVEFPHAERKTIRHEYQYTPDSENSGMQKRFRFILKTGALWKGPIGTFTFTVDGLHTFLIDRASLSLPGAAIGDRQISWNLADLNPTQDLTFTWLDRPSPVEACRYLEAWSGRLGPPEETRFLLDRLLVEPTGFVGGFNDDCVLKIRDLLAGHLSPDERMTFFRRLGFCSPDASIDFVDDNQDAILRLAGAARRAPDNRARLAVVLNSSASDRVTACVFNALRGDPGPDWFDLNDQRRTGRMLDRAFALVAVGRRFHDTDPAALRTKVRGLLERMAPVKRYAGQAADLLARLTPD